MALKTISAKKPEDTTKYTASTYNSQYGGQLDSALSAVTNYKYDPTSDANYQSLARIYSKRGEQAAKNTIGNAASLNGGYGSSYATTAAQQARNDYNQEFAARIPELQQADYSRKATTLSALREADNTAYGKFRDSVGDNQWQYTQDYGKYRDAVGDYQWAKDYNANVYALKKGKSSGGSRRSGGSSGSGGYVGSSTSSLAKIWNKATTAKKSSTTKKATTTKAKKKTSNTAATSKLALGKKQKGSHANKRATKKK